MKKPIGDFDKSSYTILVNANQGSLNRMRAFSAVLNINDSNFTHENALLTGSLPLSAVIQLYSGSIRDTLSLYNDWEPVKWANANSPSNHAYYVLSDTVTDTQGSRVVAWLGIVSAKWIRCIWQGNDSDEFVFDSSQGISNMPTPGTVIDHDVYSLLISGGYTPYIPS